jgi:alkylation response protein AidB-like acyl-CoA dehydrogenase
MIARALLAQDGIDIPDGPVVIAPVPVRAVAQNGDESGIDCRSVPFGRIADQVLVSHSSHSDDAADILLPASRATRRDTGVNGSQQAHLAWHDVSAGTRLVQRHMWQELAALATAAQIAGAMDRILAITVSYAGDRVQFGRPIGKFQAVQQQLSVLAELATASRMAGEIGCAYAASLAPNPLAAAVAKARASEAAEAAVKIAHAVHAAMGITAEYDLQLYTRRLIEWRTDYGSAGYWNRRVGDAVLSSDAPSMLEFMLPAFFPETGPC